MSDVVIRAENLSKLYRIKAGAPAQHHRTAREQLSLGLRSLMWNRRPAGETAVTDYWALKGISFEIRQGDRVGIIGRNGAGKSTLLKVLSKIIMPTGGQAMVRGRLASLLEVGTGFHPELTGRENIYLNGSLLGMSLAEIDRVFDAIVEFAGIATYLETPVKRYSSGMYTRLAFAVAAHLEPDILIVDEVLAVGDAAFQQKCIDRTQKMNNEGRTIIFVSHNMALVNSLCSRAMVLEGGRIHTPMTATSNAIAAYHKLMQQDASFDQLGRADRSGTGHVRLTRVQCGSTSTASDSSVFMGSSLNIIISILARDEEIKNKKLDCSISIVNMWGHLVGFTDTAYFNKSFVLADQTRTLRFVFRHFMFGPGDYHVNVALTSGGELEDVVEHAGTFRCESGNYFGNGAQVPSGIECYIPECEIY